jgi:pyrimidine-nucleoside phosphorylase
MSSLLKIITDKRQGREHSFADLEAVSRAAAEGTAPDYQLAAWLMAAFLNGLSPREAAWLTKAMAESGERLDLSSLPRPWVDKHSTGGVGDKTTLVLLPLLASCDITMVKMSGKGLGITGGTIDKLNSVPGFRTDFTPEEMVRQAKDVGCALTGQTPRLAPADKTLYALRDATGTVESRALIASSILSKKIAGGAETIVLDIKCGSGSFMQDLSAASALRDLLVSIGEELGLTIRAAVTDMDQPLGRAIGNALEVKEAIRVLRGDEHGATRELCLALAGMTLEAVGREASDAVRALESGAALQMAMHWFHAQGADLDVFDEEDWQTAPVVEEIVWEGEPGWASRVDARLLGEFARDMGAGRLTKEDEVDPRVGLEVLVRVGDRVEPGQPVLRVHRGDREAALDSGWLGVSDVAVPARQLMSDESC